MKEAQTILLKIMVSVGVTNGEHIAQASAYRDGAVSIQCSRPDTAELIAETVAEMRDLLHASIGHVRIDQGTDVTTWVLH